MLKPVDSQVSFPRLEEDILDFWKKNRIFAKSLDLRRGGKEFIFYDGPPFATGLPHYGHLLAGTIKDVVPRYQTMRGKFVDRVFGWDCHGLPVEYEMEKELNLSGKTDIENYGVGRFNEACRDIVLRYTAEWENVVTRMGRWVDFERGYRTMDLNFMESIWWVFKQLWDRGLVYEGHKVLPYCPRCATPLSNFEANQGYAEVEDPAITVRFQSSLEPSLYYLAWTTTPWTLPSNLALAVNPEVEYVKVADGDCQYILAAGRLGEYYKNAQPEILARMKGEELLGAAYEPLFPYFREMRGDGAFRVIGADFVSTADGTGIVHIAPGFGEDDAAAAKSAGVPEVCPVDGECRFTAAVADYAGTPVKEADKAIIRRLKDEGKLVHRSTIRHNYPHCWRDDTPLIYRAISTWFIRIDPIKEAMLRANGAINWVPAHIKDGRFGKWLENARDWAVSRNRYWGCPMPIWRNAEGETVCVGSVAELEKMSGRKVSDIHKHFVDDLELSAEGGGGSLRRVPEVLDCWFESGSMPYAQQHYPFENKQRFEANFPADFIAEGLDQTRGWFYTLVVLGAALFDRPAFANVVVNGLVLAEDGQKMSKRKKNYPDPREVMNKHGADALRLFMLGSQVVRGEDLRFSEEGIKEVLRGVMIPIWNAYSFLVTYARVDGWEPPANLTPGDSANPLDRWILASANQMVGEIIEAMDAYQLQKAANRFTRFVGELTNWYIRRSRRRFWKSKNDEDKRDAYQTLHYVLVTFTQAAAPFIPFLAEEIYRGLRGESMPESVHLCDFPEPDGSRRDPALERQMDLAMAAVSLGRFLRSKNSLKVRQPLARATVVVADSADIAAIAAAADIIAEELNVKEVSAQGDEDQLVHRSVKPNFKALGPKCGRHMKEVASRVAGLDAAATAKLLEGGDIEVTVGDGELVAIGPDDVLVERREREGITVATEGGVTVALDTNLTPELVREGHAREFVSKIQNLRKELGFDVADRVSLKYECGDELAAALAEFSEYIGRETLAVNFSRLELAKSATKVNINEHSCGLEIQRIG